MIPTNFGTGRLGLLPTVLWPIAPNVRTRGNLPRLYSPLLSPGVGLVVGGNWLAHVLYEELFALPSPNPHLSHCRVLQSSPYFACRLHGRPRTSAPQPPTLLSQPPHTALSLQLFPAAIPPAVARGQIACGRVGFVEIIPLVTPPCSSARCLPWPPLWPPSARSLLDRPLDPSPGRASVCFPNKPAHSQRAP